MADLLVRWGILGRGGGGGLLIGKLIWNGGGG